MNILKLAQKAATVSPEIREVFNTTQEIIKDFNNWQMNLVNYLNKNNHQLQHVLGYLRQGSKTRSFLDSYLPGFAQRADSAVSELINLQKEASVNKGEKNSRRKSSKGAEYRILPIKKG